MIMSAAALLLSVYASLTAGLNLRRSRGGSLPKIIHQTWTDNELPPAFENWSRSWKECLPDWEYKLHTDEDNRNFIKEHVPDFLETYEGYDNPIKRVDAAKYAYLAVEGGLYVDLDVECLRAPHRLVNLSTEEKHDVILATDKFSNGGQLSNSLMLSASARGRQFFKELLYLLPYSQQAEFAASTGSEFLTRAFQDYMKRGVALEDVQERANRSDVHTSYGTTRTVSKKNMKIALVDDSWVFNIPWYAEELKQDCMDRAWCMNRFPNATSVSHWTASFFPQARARLTAPLNRTMPKIIHQTWKSRELPPEFEKWSNSWKKCLPGWEYKLHTDEDNRNFIKEHFPELLNTYDNYDKPIKRVDAARYAYMAVEGGLYADMDIECLHDPAKLLNLSAEGKFDAMLANERYSQDGGQVSNAFLVATSDKGRHFFQEIMKELPRYKNESNVITATGPMFLTSAVKDIMVDGLALNNEAERTRRSDFHTDPLGVKALSNSRTTVALLDDSWVFNIPWFDKSNSGWKKGCMNSTWCQEKLPYAVSVSHWTSSWSKKYNNTLSTDDIEEKASDADWIDLRTALNDVNAREVAPLLQAQSFHTLSTQQMCTCVLDGLMQRMPSDTCRKQLMYQLDDVNRQFAPIRWAYRGLLNFYMSFC
mmetsp:Transcript_5125/g.8453  ORF Transcript_5125/g.8453 Transcript_5125/m.8453 type:complete len:650 (-) Transcript_5125:108-2057(-)